MYMTTQTHLGFTIYVFKLGQTFMTSLTLWFLLYDIFIYDIAIINLLVIILDNQFEPKNLWYHYYQNDNTLKMCGMEVPYSLGTLTTNPT